MFGVSRGEIAGKTVEPISVTVSRQEDLFKQAAGGRRFLLKVKADAASVAKELKKTEGVALVESVEPRNGIAAFSISGEPGIPLEEALAQLVLKNRWPVYELRPLHLSLEEVFLQLTGDKS
jgi:hypothetical protein